jgi:hypothetical protein
MLLRQLTMPTGNREQVESAAQISEPYRQSKLLIGSSDELARLANEIAKIARGDIVGTKSKSLFLVSFMPRTPRRQQANNVTGNRQQARDAEMSDTASKKRRLEKECDTIPPELASVVDNARGQRQRLLLENSDREKLFR